MCNVYDDLYYTGCYRDIIYKWYINNIIVIELLLCLDNVFGIYVFQVTFQFDTELSSI